MKMWIIILISFNLFSGCKPSVSFHKNDIGSKVTENQNLKTVTDTYNMLDSIPKIIKSDAEWKKILNSKEYHVIREKGTERAFTGDLLKIKDQGIYTCKACQLPLFSSTHKFDSGTGWPSFYDVVEKKHIHEDTDYDIGYPRTEITCASCGGHLGHVFNDGPKPTGLRYCINSVSLNFVKN